MNRNILAITFRYILNSITFTPLLRKLIIFCLLFIKIDINTTRTFFFVIPFIIKLMIILKILLLYIKDEFECHCHSKTHLTYLSVCYYFYDMFAL